MKDKKQIQAFLLGFAITTIMWSYLLGFVIGKIDRDYKRQIEIIKSQVK